jgi:hypothetical protein
LKDDGGSLAERAEESQKKEPLTTSVIANTLKLHGHGARRRPHIPFHFRNQRVNILAVLDSL